MNTFTHEHSLLIFNLLLASSTVFLQPVYIMKKTLALENQVKAKKALLILNITMVVFIVLPFVVLWFFKE